VLLSGEIDATVAGLAAVMGGDWLDGLAARAGEMAQASAAAIAAVQSKMSARS
jgi:hypothetical protein